MFNFLLVLLCLAIPNLVSSQTPKNIILLAGQSNMSGRGGANATAWDGFVPNECRSSPYILRLTKGLQWVQAVEPIHKDIDEYAIVGIGPGMPFANTVLARNPGFGPIGLVPCAVGATKITQWSKGAHFYNQLVYRAHAAIQSGGKIQAILWYQGESDTIDQNDANLYQGRLEKFFNDIRSDLKSPQLLIIQVGLASGMGPFIQKVRDAQLAVRIPKVVYVEGKGLQVGQDFVHLTTAAEVQLGKMLANAFFSNSS